MNIEIVNMGRTYVLGVSFTEDVYENNLGELEVQVFPKVESVTSIRENGSQEVLFPDSSGAFVWCSLRGITESDIMDAVHNRKIL